MRHTLRAAALAAAAAAVLLAGCEREPVRTVVVKPAAPASSALPPAPASLPPPATAPEPPAAAASAPEDAKSGESAPTVPTVSSPRAAADADGAALLAARPLIVPVEGVRPEALLDTYEQDRGRRKHEAIDIAAARGTRVLAVDDGKVAKLFTSVPGGLTVYQFDPSGRLSYYYAHLDRYAPGLKEGQVLKRGELVGYVGSTGNASAEVPHLHFAVFRLGPDRKWWQGDPVNPYPALRQAQG
jgi:murein DD-endopeptidase MepM/ murein hydrolase activator NlpD